MCELSILILESGVCKCAVADDYVIELKDFHAGAKRGELDEKKESNRNFEVVLITRGSWKKSRAWKS